MQRIIDFHCHIFPDAVAPRALEVTTANSGLTPSTDGTMRSALALMDENGVSAAVTLPVCTTANQHRSVNDFAKSYDGGRFFCFGGLYPKSGAQAITEAERIKQLGLRGVKLHPDYQDYMVDDETIFPLYEVLQALDLLVVFHCGWDPVSPALVHNPPERLARVAKRFSALRIVAAHMGGYDMREQVLAHLCGLPNVWFDTSLNARQYSSAQFYEFAAALGTEKLLFATDTPWSHPKNEIEIIESAGFSDEQKQAIYYKNAEQLLLPRA